MSAVEHSHLADLSEFEQEVYFLLQKYGIRTHYRASRHSGTKYAVFALGEQVTEPKTHTEARMERDVLTAKAIGKLVACDGGRA